MDNVSTREERYQAANGTTASHQDSYLYDDLDRLISVDHVSATNEGSFSRSYQYDSRGNILYKSDAGRMTYDEGNHLLSLEGSAGNRSYTYDNNGNVLNDGVRHITWTAFNKPDTIKQGKNKTQFSYDAGNNRIKQELSTDGKNETTYYLGKSYEYVIHNEGFSDQYIQMKHHLYAGDEVVAIQVRTLHNGEKQPDVTRYLHKDALGNIDTITDAHGVIVQRAEYDAFGKRTVTQGKLHEPWTNRGYTGHEHLTDFGLIHMNARIYDPIVGRFLSADTYIQAPDISQSHNRYAYVMNNPLKYTDPSGHFWFLAAVIFIGAIVADIPILDTIANIVVGMAMNVLIPGAGFAMSFLRGAAAGFINTLAAGGNLKDAFKNGLFQGISSGIASLGETAIKKYNIRHIPKGANKVIGRVKPSWGGMFKRGVIRGLANGISSEIQGGKFKNGFGTGFGLSFMRDTALWMRADQKAQSRIYSYKDPKTGKYIHPNSDGKSAGFMGDGFKLGGGRRNLSITINEQIENRSPLGGVQGGQGYIKLLGEYQPGSFQDHLVETYAGPHDWLNSHWTYDSIGNIDTSLNGFQRAVSSVMNWTDVAIATPLVVSSVIPVEQYSYISNRQRYRY